MKRNKLSLAIKDGRETDAIEIINSMGGPAARYALESWAIPLRGSAAITAANITAQLAIRGKVTSYWAWGLISTANCGQAALALHRVHPNPEMLREVVISSGDARTAMAWKRIEPDGLDEMSLLMMVQTSGDAETATKMALSDPPMISVRGAVDVIRHAPHGPSVVRLAQAKKINGALARRLVAVSMDVDAAEDLFDLDTASEEWVNKLRVAVGLQPKNL